MSNTQQPILIAGGGIGGFAAALALAKQGFKVQVLNKHLKLVRSAQEFN